MTSLFTFLFPLSRAPEVTTYGADAKVKPWKNFSTCVSSKSYLLLKIYCDFFRLSFSDVSGYLLMTRECR